VSDYDDAEDISIHSPHAGRDFLFALFTLPRLDFNPLSPCGERLVKVGGTYVILGFQSTLPMRGET